jgi:hypothetical protein
MKTKSDRKKIRRIQAKIISTLLAAPFFKLAVYINTEFDKMFLLEGDEKNNLDVAWAMLKDDDVVYADYHEIGIKADSLSFANGFIREVNQ